MSKKQINFSNSIFCKYFISGKYFESKTIIDIINKDIVKTPYVEIIKDQNILIFKNKAAITKQKSALSVKISLNLKAKTKNTNSGSNTKWSQTIVLLSKNAEIKTEIASKILFLETLNKNNDTRQKTEKQIIEIK